MRPGAVVAGAALFFASEYGTHRFLFHAKPSRVPFVLRLQHRLHYDHHVDPAKLELLFLPPWFLGPSLSLSAALAALATRGNRDLTASVVLGNLLGLLYYEWVHYVAHVLLDRLAATYVPVAAAERSETTRLLFPDAFPDLAAR